MADFEMTRDGGLVRVTLAEKLTAAAVPVLQSALLAEIEAGASGLVFDLGRTVSVDSTGIGLLIAAGNSLEAKKGTIGLVGVSPDIMKLLRTMRLVDRLHAAAAAGEGRP